MGLKNWVKRGQVNPKIPRLPNFIALRGCEAMYIPSSNASPYKLRGVQENAINRPENQMSIT